MLHATTTTTTTRVYVVTFQIDRGYPVSGIAAGENHTVVLADDQNFCPTVYFSGTEPGYV